jgi:hypothetical protein
VALAAQYERPAEAACALRDHAHMLGSTDNISVIVYRLDKAPPKKHASKGSNAAATPATKASPRGERKD